MARDELARHHEPHLRLNGQAFTRFAAVGPGTIEITSTIDAHQFEIVTGYRGDGTRAAADPTATPRTAAAASLLASTDAGQTGPNPFAMQSQGVPAVRRPDSVRFQLSDLRLDRGPVHSTSFKSMTDLSEAFLDGTAHWLLIFAHPGHELRAHHVMERTRPSVAILTDGSGSTGVSRADHTTELLAETGARPATIFCALSDRDAYAALMARNAEPFVTIRDRLIKLMLNAGHTAVLVDAAEGYNPVHDLCHWIGRAAAARASRFGTQIDVFELDLVSHPDGRGNGLRLALDDQAFARKLAAAEHYSALGSEADAALAGTGGTPFASSSSGM